jgi:hypothetical protein
MHLKEAMAKNKLKQFAAEHGNCESNSGNITEAFSRRLNLYSNSFAYL